jgi:hypothetical protein
MIKTNEDDFSVEVSILEERQSFVQGAFLHSTFYQKTVDLERNLRNMSWNFSIMN